MECFYEQFQTKDYGSLEKILNILSKVSLVIAILFATMLNLVFAVAFGLIYLVIFILSRNLIVEYEYELTADELVIFKIMNKSKRKQIGSFNIREISSVKSPERLEKSNSKIIKAYLEEAGLKDMVYMTKTSQGVVGFQLAMDENLTNLIKRVNPLAFY
ncbi:hypothetical protein PMY38_11505 [Clostridium tertium]|uniref:Uncharacterized protein n=1 Tax=Clostridium tertium TaxID=1559 RepID=A0A9X3XR14_9CLOT|nr:MULTISPECIES: hypothetical protein [Clostridium]EEH99592.1 hypothetical protein CSBG_03218 [Clostridium sp. 7_2_43FAA]MDB1949119.1 hypothetical protein [Clostridium tertium]MDB1955517.1 hypothetical protein [Clostridium tertium]MDB1959225.1 hypothetical protein [Clostridium tertium]MDB1961834.1 hypothetical protein [Clostridium tertium]